jgi:arabinofuranan 3-O-arabinosyltransferase
MMRRWQAVACGAAGIAVMATVFWRPCLEHIQRGDNDFQVSYVSGQLIMRGQIYNTPVFQAAERAILGRTNPDLLDTRPPFLALVFWPLAQLPYRLAWPLFACIAAAAVVAFIWLWPDRPAAALACCWSGALWAALGNGQDVLLILVWLGTALRIRESRPFLAGLLLSLCAAKFHFFVFLPVLLWRHRLWRGFAAGAAGLVAISFGVAGWDWPRQYLATVAQEEAVAHANAAIMPNLHGLFATWPHAGAWELLASLGVAGGVVAVIRRADFPTGLAAVLAGGLLVSRHAYLQDCALLLPALLIVLPVARGWGLLALAWLLAPASALAVLAGHPAGDITRLAILALLGSVVAGAYPTLRAQREAHGVDFGPVPAAPQ